MERCPVRVSRVVLNGDSGIKEDVIQHFFSAVFAASNLGEIAETAYGCARRLLELKLFKRIELRLDKTSSPSRGCCELQVTPIDCGRTSARLGTVISSLSEGSASPGQLIYVQGKLLNLFGRAEELSAKAGLDTSWASNYQFCLTKPLLFWKEPSQVEIEVHKSLHDNSRKTCTKELVKGIIARFATGRHVISHQIGWHDIMLQDDAPLSLRRHGEVQTLKSSLTHTYLAEGRDNPCLPLHGAALRLHTELAGLGGDVSFLKHTSALQLNHSLHITARHLAVHGQLAGACGMLVRRRGDVYPSDRFYLGGGTGIMRGFANGGVNPGAARGTVGGDAYVAVGTSCGLPLPAPAPRALRAHVFAGAGNVVPICWSAGPVEAVSGISRLLRELRAACGVGLVWEIAGAGQIEVNISKPLSSRPMDRTESFQVSFSAAML